jgi:hypothetical protein
MMTPVSDGRSADRPKLGERRSIRWAAQGVFVPSPASKRDGRAELAAQVRGQGHVGRGALDLCH